MFAILIALVAASGEGRPLFEWAERGPVVVADAPAAPAGETSPEAHVAAVDAAREADALVLRFRFDRAVGDAVHLPDGTPVSGRLRALLYLDADDNRSTGLASGPDDPRTGADARLEIGVVSVAADAEEQVAAAAVVSAVLYGLAPDGRRRALWRGDDESAPASVSAHGTDVEVRVPAASLVVAPTARLVLAQDDRVWVGRLSR